MNTLLRIRQMNYDQWSQFCCSAQFVWCCVLCPRCWSVLVLCYLVWRGIDGSLAQSVTRYQKRKLLHKTQDILTIKPSADTRQCSNTHHLLAHCHCIPTARQLLCLLGAVAAMAVTVTAPISEYQLRLLSVSGPASSEDWGRGGEAEGRWTAAQYAATGRAQ